MGIQRPEAMIYECDECGSTTERPTVDPSIPEGWVHIPTAAPAADWFCGWACVKSYADKRLEEVAV